MRISVQAEILSKIISIVEKATKPKHTLPELATILIKVDKDHTEFIATDLEMQVTAKLPIGGEHTGEVAVYAQAFARYLGTIDPSEQVELAIQDGKLIVSSNKSKASFNVVSTENFPYMQVPELKPYANIDKSVFANALEKTLFATLKGDDTRPVLGGVFFDGAGEQLTLVALDTFRMSVYKLNTQVQEKKGVVVPHKVLALFEKIVKDSFVTGLFGDAEVQIEVAPDLTLLALRFGDIIVYSKLIEGTYPDYKSIIPTEFNIEGTVALQELNIALRRIGVFAQQSIGRQVVLEAMQDSLKLSASAQESGEATEVIPATFEGERLPLKIGFQYKFLQEFLNVTSGDQIKMKFIDPVSTAVFGVVGDDNFIHIIMPLKL